MGLGGVDPASLGPPELLAGRHDLAEFTCGEAVLDDWLRRRARTNQESGVSRTYVVAETMRVVGYYSLAAGAISLATAPGRVRRNMPDPIPMVVLGRLAVDRIWQGRGLGRLLLKNAIQRAFQASKAIGVRGVLVHALSPAAQHFYENAGFLPSPLNPMTLILPLKDAAPFIEGE